MTDARLKGEWLTAAAHDRLSDQAYRVLHNALMHCAEQGSDGVIAARELRFLYPGPLERDWCDELERAGFWEELVDGYRLIGWSTTLGQSTAQQVEEYREGNRERQRAYRKRAKEAREAAEAAEALRSEAVTGDVISDVTRDEHRESLGKDRTGPEGPVLAEQQEPRAHKHRFVDMNGDLRCDICGDRADPIGEVA